MKLPNKQHRYARNVTGSLALNGSEVLCVNTATIGTPVTVTLNGSPLPGELVTVLNAGGWQANAVTIAAGGNLIEGSGPGNTDVLNSALADRVEYVWDGTRWQRFMYGSRGAVASGTLAARPVTAARGDIYVVAGDATADNNGKAFVWNETAAAWNEISGPDLAALDARYVNVVGDTMTGPLVLPADPTLPLQAATKQYVDARVGATTTAPALMARAQINAVAAVSGTWTNIPFTSVMPWETGIAGLTQNNGVWTYTGLTAITLFVSGYITWEPNTAGVRLAGVWTTGIASNYWGQGSTVGNAYRISQYYNATITLYQNETFSIRGFHDAGTSINIVDRVVNVSVVSSASAVVGTSLAALTDVNVTPRADGSVIRWDAATSKYVHSTAVSTTSTNIWDGITTVAPKHVWGVTRLTANPTGAGNVVFGGNNVNSPHFPWEPQTYNSSIEALIGSQSAATWCGLSGLVDQVGNRHLWSPSLPTYAQAGLQTTLKMGRYYAPLYCVDAGTRHMQDLSAGTTALFGAPYRGNVTVTSAAGLAAIVTFCNGTTSTLTSDAIGRRVFSVYDQTLNGSNDGTTTTGFAIARDAVPGRLNLFHNSVFAFTTGMTYNAAPGQLNAVAVRWVGNQLTMIVNGNTQTVTLNTVGGAFRYTNVLMGGSFVGTTGVMFGGHIGHAMLWHTNIPTIAEMQGLVAAFLANL